MIPINQCVDRTLYRVKSKNLIAVAVYCESNQSFYGIRHKLGNRFISGECHCDIGGTCDPTLDLDIQLPEGIEFTDSKELLDWIDQITTRFSDCKIL